MIRRALRRALESRGWKGPLGLPYGVDFMRDVGRLSQAWHLPIRTFFDVGANVGKTSESALAIFKNAKVFAFEPHPQSFSQLQARLANNARFSAYNTACGNDTGTVALHQYPSSLINSLVSDAQFAVRYGLAAKSMEVPCVTLDDFCNQHRIHDIDVLKIDTEGYDLKVLLGAQKILSAGNIRFVYTEFNDMLPKPGTTGGALVPIAEFIAPFGFRFVAAYTDFINLEGEMFTVANALFVLPPQGLQREV
jgi:FkbM family methyltransferase